MKYDAKLFSFFNKGLSQEGKSDFTGGAEKQMDGKIKLSIKPVLGGNELELLISADGKIESKEIEPVVIQEVLEAEEKGLDDEETY